MPPAWHTVTDEALSRELRMDLGCGLTDREARTRLTAHGPNELPQAPSPSPLSLLFRQFSSLIIWVLIGAAVVSGLLGEWIDTAAILTIVLLNAVLGVVQE